jgi:cobalt-zinc-cadmium efflux system membrane fusion protein
MIRKDALITGVALTLAFHISTAEEITVSPAEIRNLGIELSIPKMAQETTTIEATAHVVIPPMGDVFVSAPQSGLLTRLNVAVGDEVVQGQAIAELQGPEFLALQRKFLDAINTNLLAQSDYARDQQLHDEGIISGRRLQETTTRARIATTGVNEHRQLLKFSGLTDAEIRALENDQRLLQTLTIHAPINGVVIDRMAIAGERLDRMSPVYRIADLSSLWLEISVPREKLAAVRTGMRVAVPGYPLGTPAEVTSIARSIDPETQAIVVRAILNEPGHGLSPGEFVSVRFVADHVDTSAGPVWVLPAAAVTRSDENHYIFIRTANGFEVSEVSVITADSANVYVRADINANQKIAVRGVTTLKALWSAQSEPTT